jgi:hypothetical protein
MGKRKTAEWPDENLIAAKRELSKFIRRNNSEWPNWAENKNGPTGAAQAA